MLNLNFSGVFCCFVSLNAFLTHVVVVKAGDRQPAQQVWGQSFIVSKLYLFAIQSFIVTCVI